MDPLSLLFAAFLTFQTGSTQPTPTDYTRAVIIDTGAPAQVEPQPTTTDYTRAVIIDTGDK